MVPVCAKEIKTLIKFNRDLISATKGSLLEFMMVTYEMDSGGLSQSFDVLRPADFRLSVLKHFKYQASMPECEGLERSE